MLLECHLVEIKITIQNVLCVCVFWVFFFPNEIFVNFKCQLL